MLDYKAVHRECTSALKKHYPAATLETVQLTFLGVMWEISCKFRLDGVEYMAWANDSELDTAAREFIAKPIVSSRF